MTFQVMYIYLVMHESTPFTFLSIFYIKIGFLNPKIKVNYSVNICPNRYFEIALWQYV